MGSDWRGSYCRGGPLQSVLVDCNWRGDHCGSGAKPVSFLALRLLLGEWLSRIWDFIVARPLWAVVAVLALYGGYQHHQAAKWRHEATACHEASVAAQRAQEELRAREQQQYREQADAADSQYRAQLSDARRATLDYIASHRMQSPRSGGPAQPQREAGPSIQPAPVSGLVVVDEADVQRAAEWQAYGEACHDWAVSISQ